MSIFCKQWCSQTKCDGRAQHKADFYQIYIVSAYIYVTFQAKTSLVVFQEIPF